MKKLIIALLLMVVMVGCESTPQAPTYSQDELDTMFQTQQTAIDDLQQQILDLDYYTKAQVDTLLTTMISEIELAYYNKIEIDEGFDDLDVLVTAINQLVVENETQQGLIDELEQILINLEVIEGLNGQTVYYIPSEVLTPQSMSFQMLGSELEKNKAPSYVLDENGDYIPFADVARKLMDKYYGTYTLNSAKLGFQVSLNVDVYTEEEVNGTIVKTPIQKEEFISRTILLIEELSHYDFYIISSSQLYIQTNSYGATSWITVPIATLRSSFITLNAEVMIAGLYEVDFGQLTFNSAIVQQYYDDYVTAKSFNGYVLDYK